MSADLRDRIYEKIARGGPCRDGVGQTCMAWTPERGDRIARRLGVEPFIRSPDPDRFDPGREVSWSLTMGVAWICRRTPDAVRDAWDAFRGECWEWGRWENGRRELHRLEPLTLQRLRLMHAIDQAVGWTMSPVDGVAELARVLRAGEVTATGIDTDDQPVEIPVRDWRYLDIRTDDRTARAVMIAAGRDARIRYVDVQLDRKELIREFPKDEAAPSPNYTVPCSGSADRWIADARPARPLAVARTRSRRGRPPAIRWDIVRQEAKRLMIENGPFSPDDPKWNARARLEGHLIDFVRKTQRVDIGLTQVREKLRTWSENQQPD